MSHRGRNTRSVLIATLFLVAVLTFAMFQGDTVSWFLVFTFIPIYLYMIAMLFYSARDWQIKRTISKEKVRAGEGFSVQLEIEKTGIFPVFTCIVEEKITPSLHKRDYGKAKYEDFEKTTHLFRRMKRVLFPWFRGKFIFRYDITEVPRGIHQLNSVVITVTDLFGFIRKTISIPLETKIEIGPNMYPVSFPGKYSAEAAGTGAQMKKALHSTLVTGSRPYEQGDRLSIIDWKQTARKQELMTKEFEVESGSACRVVFNEYVMEHVSEPAYEVAIEAVLYIVSELTKEQAVHFISFGEKLTHLDLESERELGQLGTQLTRIKSQEISSHQQFNQAFHTDSRHYYNELFFVTTMLSQALLQQLEAVKSEGKSVTLVFIESQMNHTDQTERVLNQLKQQRIQVIYITDHPKEAKKERGL